jgi:chemotaxis protein MotB
MPKNKKGKEAPRPNIIIKKRISRGEDGHHGGTWKIAYADFMTAMMAFFLVMWLVSSSSKEKITALANYFNPVKLSEKTLPSKGVRDEEAGGNEQAASKKAEKSEKSPEAKEAKEAKETKETKETKEAKAEKAEKAKKAEKAEKTEKAEKDEKKTESSHEEETLFRNPFGVLTQLASEAEGEMAVAMARASSGSLSMGGANNDPFATDPVASQPVSRAAHTPGREAAQHDAPGTGGQRGKAKAEAPADEKQTGAGKKPGDASEPRPNRETEDAAAQLSKEVSKLVDSLPRSFRPNITTKATSEGILVSLTDDMAFSMFKIASAEPSPQLVLVLEKVGNLISKQPGKLVVRGHTDGRQYAGDLHGNWRLSMNRANMAYYMLLRSKVDGGRFLAVEGYADRSLKNKANPLAAENRRIDILIKAAES